MSEAVTAPTRADLEREVARLNKVVGALMRRIQREEDAGGDRGYAHFQAAASLEAVVRERTESLEYALNQLEQSNQALRTAKRAADKANNAKSRFLATMSHEIRTPMTGVMGALELLTRTQLTPRQAQLIETMQRASDGLLRVINDVLDFSRLDRPELELRPAPFAPRALVESVVELHRQRAQAKGLSLGVDIDDGIPAVVVGDEGRVSQVLGNLVDNAIKYTPAGSVSVSLALVGAGRWGAGLRFAVADTGVGIPEGDRERVFDSFHQADTSSTRPVGGTGLGLAIVRRLVEHMGGGLRFESEEGVGTTFICRLPFGWPEDAGQGEPYTPPETPALAPTAPVSTEPANAQAARILVADDNEINRSYLRDALELWGYPALFVTDGLGAIEAYHERAIDLILMDWRMPHLDGLAATRRIREIEAAASEPRHVPIIALTASALAGDREQCLEAGMDDFLGKPFTLDQLQSMIQRWLSVRSSVTT